jgi:hypothetical protein
MQGNVDDRPSLVYRPSRTTSALNYSSRAVRIYVFIGTKHLLVEKKNTWIPCFLVIPGDPQKFRLINEGFLKKNPDLR